MKTMVYIGEFSPVKQNKDNIINNQLVVYVNINIQDLGDFKYTDEKIIFRNEINKKKKILNKGKEVDYYYTEIPKTKNDYIIDINIFPKDIQNILIKLIEDTVNNMSEKEIKEIWDGFIDE